DFLDGSCRVTSAAPACFRRDEPSATRNTKMSFDRFASDLRDRRSASRSLVSESCVHVVGQFDGRPFHGMPAYHVISPLWRLPPSVQWMAESDHDRTASVAVRVADLRIVRGSPAAPIRLHSRSERSGPLRPCLFRLYSMLQLCERH